jgi:transcriptional regulator with XRE-family HTH domain
MSAPDRAEDSSPVNGEWERGQAIKRRRLAAGIKSLREFSKATGVARAAITAAEDGHGSKGTYERLEAWLDEFDDATGDDVHGLLGIEQMTLTVEGQEITVTVRGPITDREGLKRDAADLWRIAVRESSANPVTDTDP